VRITFPAGFEEGTLQFVDTQGRIMARQALNGRQAFAEVELRNWPQGLYFVQLLLAGHQVATTKFTVLR
jgi:hypothetical protein